MFIGWQMGVIKKGRRQCKLGTHTEDLCHMWHYLYPQRKKSVPSPLPHKNFVGLVNELCQKKTGLDITTVTLNCSASGVGNPWSTGFCWPLAMLVEAAKNCEFSKISQPSHPCSTWWLSCKDVPPHWFGKALLHHPRPYFSISCSSWVQHAIIAYQSVQSQAVKRSQKACKQHLVVKITWC